MTKKANFIIRAKWKVKPPFSVKISITETTFRLFLLIVFKDSIFICIVINTEVIQLT